MSGIDGGSGVRRVDGQAAAAATAARTASDAARHFFISRAGPDAAYAVKLAHILEDAGYRVIVQDRDIVNQSFMAAMQAALTSGARTIALLSNDYLDATRPHCAAEWQATIADDPLNSKRRLIVLRVAECAPAGLLKSLAYWDLVRLGGNDTLLADVVLGAVNPDAGKALPEAVAHYWREAQAIVHHEIRATPSFTGRGEAMADIDAAISQGQVTAITQAPVALHGSVALHGMGGIGKSTLARQYAFEASQYPIFAGIWWLNAARDGATGAYDGIESALLDLRAQLYPGAQQPTERAPAARQMLDYIASGGEHRSWLLVYDNVDDMAALQAWPPPSNARVLVTTRLSGFRKGEVAAIEIEEWALPDAVRYLARESGRDDFKSGEADAIAQALGRLPLALSHAAAYLREVANATPASYLTALSAHMRRVPPGITSGVAVFATFQQAIERAEAKAPGAAAVMALAAVLAPDNIPEELFQQAPESYPPALATVVADPLRLEAAIGALARLSLIDFDRDSRTFSVHRLVQAAARDGLKGEAVAWTAAAKDGMTGSAVAANTSPPPPRGGESQDGHRQWLAAAVAACVAAYPGSDFKHWPAYERLLPHARALAEVADSDLGVPLALLLHQAGYYLNERAAYAEAEPLYQRALEIREAALGPDHPNVGTSLNNLAGLYGAQGKYDRAEPLYQRSLEIREAALGPDHPDVGQSLNNLAALYYRLERFDEAAPLARRAHAIVERALGAEHPNTTTVAEVLAAIEAAVARGDG